MKLNEATTEQLQSALDYLQSRYDLASSSSMKTVIRRDMQMVLEEMDSREVVTL